MFDLERTDRKAFLDEPFEEPHVAVTADNVVSGGMMALSLFFPLTA